MKNQSNFYKIYAVVLILSVVSIFAACSRSSKTLAELGDEKITLGEFEKQYLKTTNNIDSAKNKSLEDKKKFLDLYINFRLKVKDARERGLLNNAEIQKDVAEYVKNYSPSYLIDKEIVEPEIKKLYDRKKEEVRASHILITLGEKATPQDSIAAYQKADSIIAKLKAGEDFGEVAMKYSSDRTVAQNRGDLYYFTGGMTVDEFETAIYDMKVGEYTKTPVRTMFGLHIIKLTDKKPRIESVRASHILIQDKRDSTGKVVDSLAMYQKAMDVYNKAKNGEDWNALVQQFTEDPGSKAANGDLGFFERRRMTQPFDSAVFTMKIGNISEPIRTQYGWHIIKKIDEKPLLAFEKQLENLKTEYKRTKKYKDDYAKFVEGLKKKFNFKIVDDGYNMLRSKFDPAKSISDYNLDSLLTQSDKDKLLATFDGGTIKVADMLNHLNVNRDFQKSPLTDETLKSIISSACEQPLLVKAADDKNIKKDKEFEEVIKEYENGLLVFRIDQDELWTKVKVNETDMSGYYESNKTKYAMKDSTGKNTFRPFDQVKPEISNDLQQLKFKETEKAYLDGLRQKYPVKINTEVLNEAFKE